MTVNDSPPDFHHLCCRYTAW